MLLTEPFGTENRNKKFARTAQYCLQHGWTRTCQDHHLVHGTFVKANADPSLRSRRRAVKEQSKSEAAVNHRLGCLGWYVRSHAGSPIASVMSRDATDIVGDWQWQLKSRSPASERSEVVLTERQ